MAVDRYFGVAILPGKGGEAPALVRERGDAALLARSLSFSLCHSSSSFSLSSVFFHPPCFMQAFRFYVLTSFVRTPFPFYQSDSLVLVAAPRGLLLFSGGKKIALWFTRHMLFRAPRAAARAA